LVGELRGKFPEPVDITIDDWEEIIPDEQGYLSNEKRAEVHRTKLWYEHYMEKDDDMDYFGVSESSLQSNSDDDIARQAANLIGEIVEYVDPTLVEERDIREIKQTEHNPTTRKALIQARRGQGKFRSDLLKAWGGCAVTTWTVGEVLRASHIKAWRSSNNRERLDPNNGLLLCATLDALFDKAMISFDDDGRIMISWRLTPEDRKMMMLEEMTLSKPLTGNQKQYLKFHRREFERKSRLNLPIGGTAP
jgi:predicted restriction endonuclease